VGVCSLQALPSGSLVAVVLVGICAARAWPCRDPPGWSGGHPAHAVWASGCWGAGVGSSPGHGLLPGCVCLPWAGLQAGRVPQAVLLPDWAAGASALTLHRGGGSADEADAAADGCPGQGEGALGLGELGTGAAAEGEDVAGSLVSPSRMSLTPAESHGEGCEADGGRGAELLPASHQPPHPGDAAPLQQRSGHHLQHLPVLPEGEVWQEAGWEGPAGAAGWRPRLLKPWQCDGTAPGLAA